MVKSKKIWAIISISLIVMPFAVYAFPLDENFFDDLGNFKEMLSEGTNGIQADAGQIQVKNEIKVSSNTGGNTAGSGEVKEGEAKTNIEIKNTINGKEIDPVEIKTEGSEVKVKSEIEANEERAQVQRETEIDSVKKSETYEVDLKNPESNAPSGLSQSSQPDGSLFQPAEKETIQKEETMQENGSTPKESANFFQNQWSNFIEKIKDFFQNIFNIF